MKSGSCLVACAILACAASAGTAELQLAGDRKLNVSLARNGVVTCRLAGATGKRVAADQRDEDVALELLDASGAVVLRRDAFEFGVEWMTLPDPLPAGATLRLRRHESGAVSAPLQIWLTPATGTDEAERLSTEARDLSARRTAEARQQSAAEWERAAAAWRAAGDRSAEARALMARADQLHWLSRYDEARALFTAALEMSKADGEVRAEAQCINNRGLGWWQQGAFNEAIADLEAAARVWPRVHCPEGIATTEANLGLLAWQVGEYQSARERLERGRSMARAGGNRQLEMLVAHNLGLTFWMLGDYRASARLFLEAAAGLEAIGDGPSAGRSLTNSVRALLELGRIKEAEANVRRGVELIEAGGDKRALAGAWDRWAEVALREGHPEEAQKWARKAQAGYAAVGDRLGEANARTSLGIALKASGDRAGALVELAGARDLHHKLGTPAAEANVLYHLAAVRRDAGELDAAGEAAAAAVAIEERLRGTLSGAESRISFLAARYESYRLLAEIRIAQGRVEEGWQTAERSRARVLVEALRGGATAIDASAALRQERQKLVRQVNADSFALSRDATGTEERRLRFDGLLERLAVVETQLRAADERYRGLADPAPPRLADVQRELLDDKTVLVEFLIGEQRSYAWRIGRTGLATFELPGRAVLEQQAARLERAIAGSRTGTAAALDECARAGQSLGNAVLGEALRGVTARRLLIVPDGVLQGVPFAVLRVAGGPALVERYELAELPSTATLVAVRRSTHARRPAAHLLAVVADPVFEAADPRVAGSAAAAKRPPEYARLVFSRREAMAVAKLAQGRDVRLRTDFDATREVLTSGSLGDYRMLHLSTHGVADAARPEQSALVFSLVDPHGKPRAGRVTAADVSSLRLKADLVALSACRTAGGAAVRGEGLIGLTRAFLHAGAARVAATLWRVDDEATAELFTRFYNELLARPGMQAAAALRAAQLEMRRDSRWRSPYYWAGLILNGEP